MKPFPIRHGTQSQSGYSVLECLVALCIITISLTTFLRGINTLNRVQQSTRERQQAIQLIANAMEQLPANTPKLTDETPPLAELPRLLALESNHMPGLLGRMSTTSNLVEFTVYQTNDLPRRKVYTLSLPLP